MDSRWIWSIMPIVVTLEVVVSSAVGLNGQRLLIDVCDFGERQYSIGETWHPYLRPHGTNYCIQCTCHSYGQVRCSNTECPTLTCANPRPVPGKCCPQCEENLGYDVLPTPEPTFLSCQYQDKHYAHGELFSTEDIFLSRRRDQCVQCSCSEGKVYCALKTCLSAPCSNPVVLPDSCCPVCHPQDIDENFGANLKTNSNDLEEQTLDSDPSTHPNIPGAALPIDDLGNVGVGDSHNTASVLTQLGFGSEMEDLGQETNDVCESNGELYYEGQTWHPTLFPFGTMKCIACTCKRGNADCGRVECPSEATLPCDNPIQIHGRCCKVCPDSIKLAVHDGIGQSSILYTDSTPDLTTQQLSLCLRKSEDILVYQYRLISEDTSRNDDMFQYAIENLETDEVELHVWQLSEGVIEDFQIGLISLDSFTTLQEEDRHGRFQLMGASTTHRLRKLKRKERKIQQTCTSNCQKRLAKLTRTLKAREITPSGDCETVIQTAKQRRKDNSRSG